MTACSIITNAQIWNNLQNLKVVFKIKNAGISVDGSFNEVSGAVNIDEKNFSKSTLTGVIQATSVNTGNSMRDGHLRDKAEFFNVKKFPTITMKAVNVGSTQVGGSYKVDWLITMKGVTKKVTTDVLVNINGSAMFVLTVFKINRRDWGLGSKSLLMSDEVVLTVSGNVFKPM